MKLAELKKLMPNADDTVLAANLKIINDDAQLLVDAEVKGLKENKTKLLGQMDKLKGNQLPDGFDADAYSTYTKEKVEFDKKKKELEDLELEGKGQWEALKLKLNTAHSTAYDTMVGEKDGTIAGLTKALDKELIENAAVKAITEQKGNSFFLLPHMRNLMKTVQGEDGNYSVQIVDEKGNARFQDDATTAFGVKDLVSEMKANTNFAPAFEDSNSGGGGGAGGGAGGGGAGGVNPWKKETKNITQQAQMNKNDPTLAAQMKKAAGVA